MTEKPNMALQVLRSQRGAVLVTSMVILVVLTIIGVAANNTSVLEILVSNASKNKQSAFHAAEAGIEHGRILVGTDLGSSLTKPPFVTEGQLADWNSLFESGSGYSSVSGSPRQDEKYLKQNQSIGDYTYTLTFYDDEAKPGKPHCSGGVSDCWEDTDGMIMLRSVSQGPQNSRAAIEVGLLAQWTDDGVKRIMDYSAQDKSGAGKGSSNTDTAAIGAGLATTQLNTSI